MSSPRAARFVIPLALALAAQKTVENLFGSFSIGVDQPFREGDFIKVGELQGTVERIGLRSTRLRTLERTLVTFPNGKLADSTVESFAPRDRIARVCLGRNAHWLRNGRLEWRRAARRPWNHKGDDRKQQQRSGRACAVPVAAQHDRAQGRKQREL